MKIQEIFKNNQNWIDRKLNENARFFENLFPRFIYFATHFINYFITHFIKLHNLVSTVQK